MRALMVAVFAVSTLLWGGARAQPPARIYAAGSLASVLPKLIQASGLPADSFAPPVFGPAGVLRQRLLNGEQADLFASADTAQPSLVAGAKGGLVVPFARNRMCVIAPARQGLTQANLLDRLLAPDFRLATSTPGADPGGDYAWGVFAKADAVHPGARATLSDKALKLLGGPAALAPLPGHGAAATIFLGNHADGLLVYCSGAAGLAKEVPDIAVTPVPETLEVNPVYAFAILSNRPEIQRLALFILSDQGQRILAQGGLLPLVSGR
jgi:ABC-type molybdate transport system substrate-binding protein